MFGSANPSAHSSGLIGARPQTIAQPSGTTPGRHPLNMGGRRDGIFLMPERLDAARPAPLIVSLHGAGGIARHALDIFAAQAEARGIIVLAPESRSTTWDVIRGGYGPDVDFIERALDKVFRLHAIDPERIAVAGFSDGASYALSIGIINGTLFKDILAFSPGFMAPTGQSDLPRVFISHGVHDEVLSIDRCSRRIVPTLKRAGYDVEYQEFDGGHVVPPSMVDRAVARLFV
jgi:phospholipase/carboxylesterase